MPAKKKQTSAQNKQPPSNPQPQPETPEVEVDPLDAAVIASLVASGVEINEAKDRVLNGAPPAEAPAPAQAVVVEEDVEPPIVKQKSKDFSDDQVKLFNILQEIDEDGGVGEHEITFTVPTHIYDWVIRKTLQEAFVRNNPNFLIPEFILLLLKEQRAIDPTKGGKLQHSASGPKELYNPATGQWA